MKKMDELLLSLNVLKLNRAALKRLAATLLFACAAMLGALLAFSYVSQAQATPLENEVLAWGLAYAGQTGVASPGTQILVPTPSVQLATLHTERGIVDVVAGTSHNIALAADGTMWAWGLGTHGQLGRIGNASNSFAPVEVPALTAISQTQGVRQLAAGWDHNIMLTDAGNVYVWGRGLYSQLGMGDGLARYTPTRNPTLSALNLERVFTGWRHGIAITSEGHAYVWGWGSNGELGLLPASTRGTPVRNPALTTTQTKQSSTRDFPPILQICCTL